MTFGGGKFVAVLICRPNANDSSRDLSIRLTYERATYGLVGDILVL
jgi:hypothetical protein